jgi:hypothetical protein
MPHIVSVLKREMSRAPRKEVRSGTQGLNKSVGAYRAEITALKPRTQALEQELRRLTRTSLSSARPEQTVE